MIEGNIRSLSYERIIPSQFSATAALKEFRKSTFHQISKFSANMKPINIHPFGLIHDKIYVVSQT